MIITCPHCQTKYQVTYEAIGSAGRKVQCAHCHQAWNQDATAAAAASGTAKINDGEQADKLFDAIAEDALDEAMSAEESAAGGRNGPAATAGSQPQPLSGAEAAELQKRQMAFLRRQNAMISSLPLARLRRAARFVGVAILVGLVGGAYFGRVPIVERYPDLAGLYDAIGLGVNVVGLEFSDLATLKQLSGGNDVLTVSAQIVGRASRPVAVPPVVVSLLDADGRAVYEWSVSPRVRDLMTGERATFDTRLSLPPSEAVRVRLSFASGGASERGTGVVPEQPPPGLIDTLLVPVESTGPAAPVAPSDNQTAQPDHAPAAVSEHQ
ncbi:DUF3426 domain-containing protein [Devosia sp. CAU 1758]